MSTMSDTTALAERFEGNRDRLRAVAYRMLGSENEADDAVQEAWLRLDRTNATAIDNLEGWLTTTTSRICLDILRSRKSRREDPTAFELDAPLADPDPATDPERQALLADSIGPALLLVLETLAPTERLAFVLHDMFAVSFDEIAPIVDKSPAATRQLASRARRRIQGAELSPEADLVRQRRVVDAFLAASRNGDFQGLLAVLDPDVVLRADEFVVLGARDAGGAGAGAPLLAAEIRGAEAVTAAFVGRARGNQAALIDGSIGSTFAPGGVPKAAFRFVISGDRITGIEVIGDPDHLGRLDLTVLN
jgi:RNA polymerase sigma-70 factor (ECF subfamily)